jgi:predicted double-glycine peptidase
VSWTIRDLKLCLEAGCPVIVALQAWHGDVADPALDYSIEWDDGHYVVVCGMDDERVFFMDPSTLGNYTFLPINAFESRWHDWEWGAQQERIELHLF